MRFLLLLLPLALAACSSPGADLTPEAARALADTAAAGGETRTALALYKRAAKEGDLDALRSIARAMEQGYLRAPEIPGDGVSGTRLLPLLVLPGQAGRWRARYEREKDRQAAEGDPHARLRVAEDLTYFNRGATQAERDSARVIRQGLVAEGYGPALIPEAMRLFHQENDREAADAMLARVAGLYAAQACAIRVSNGTIPHNDAMLDVSAEATAATIDAYEACPDLPNGIEKRSVQIVRNVKRGGIPAFEGHLDSLRTLGVFERHPHLDQI